MTEKIKTPELDKMLKVKNVSQAIGMFIDWLQQEKQIVFAIYDDGNDMLEQVRTNTEKFLAEYFGIDLEKAEKERRAILKSLQG